MEHIRDTIRRWFTYHRPKNDQQERYERLRNAGGELAQLVAASVPDCPERTKAIACVREAVMWSNAGIACNE